MWMCFWRCCFSLLPEMSWNIPETFQDLLTQPLGEGWSCVPLTTNPERRWPFCVGHPAENTAFTFWKNTLFLNYYLGWHHLTSQMSDFSARNPEVHRLTLIFIEELDLPTWDLRRGVDTKKHQEKWLHQLSLWRIYVKNMMDTLINLFSFRGLIQQKRFETRW